MERYKKELGKTKKNIYKKNAGCWRSTNRKGRTRELYQQIREITGKPKTNIGTIISRTGVEHIEKGNIIKRWK